MVDRRDVESGRAVLRERDRVIGLEAAAESARARADRLEVELEVARERLRRKNQRIAELTARLDALEPQASGSARRGLSRIGSRRRTVGR